MFMLATLDKFAISIKHFTHLFIQVAELFPLLNTKFHGWEDRELSTSVKVIRITDFENPWEQKHPFRE